MRDSDGNLVNVRDEAGAAPAVDAPLPDPRGSLAAYFHDRDDIHGLNREAEG